MVHYLVGKKVASSAKEMVVRQVRLKVPSSAEHWADRTAGKRVVLMADSTDKLMDHRSALPTVGQLVGVMAFCWADMMDDMKVFASDFD